MKFNKHKLLDELEQELQVQISQIKNNFMDQPGNVLMRSSASGGWSILQCLDHLNSYGLYYLPRIESALGKSLRSDGEFYKSGWLGDYFTRIMAPETSKKKYKAFKGHIPSEELDPSAVLTEFLRQEDLLLSFVRQARGIDPALVRIPVSISPWIRLKLGDTLRFIVAHNKRHLLQAAGNLQSIPQKQKNG